MVLLVDVVMDLPDILLAVKKPSRPNDAIIPKSDQKN